MTDEPEITSLEELSAKAVGKNVKEAATGMLRKLAREEWASGIEGFIDEILAGSDYIFRHTCPGNILMVQNAVMKGVELAIDYKGRGTAANREIVSEIKAIFPQNVRYIRLLFLYGIDPKVKHLNTTYFDSYTEVYLRDICYRLTNLVRCTLQRGDELQRIGQKTLRNLRAIKFETSASDSVIRRISDCCPFLEELQVKSPEVTDACVPDLLRCTRLRVLGLTRTSVTSNCVVTLLSSDLKITQLIHERLEEALLKYATRSVTPLHLVRAEVTLTNCRSVEAICERCPELTHLEIWNARHMRVHDDMSTLDKLTYLELESVNYEHDRKLEILRTQGGHLKTLVLRHITDMTLETLKYINKYCGQLREIQFHSCRFACEFIHVSSSPGLFEPGVQYFLNLHTISCSDTYIGTHHLAVLMWKLIGDKWTRNWRYISNMEKDLMKYEQINF